MFNFHYTDALYAYEFICVYAYIYICMFAFFATVVERSARVCFGTATHACSCSFNHLCSLIASCICKIYSFVWVFGDWHLNIYHNLSFSSKYQSIYSLKITPNDPTSIPSSFITLKAKSLQGKWFSDLQNLQIRKENGISESRCCLNSFCF